MSALFITAIWRGVSPELSDQVYVCASLDEKLHRLPMSGVGPLQTVPWFFSLVSLMSAPPSKAAAMAATSPFLAASLSGEAWDGARGQEQQSKDYSQVNPHLSLPTN